jgi:hypothetical protein
MWHFYFKQNVEIATLSSVARNDSARLEVAVHQQIARDDNLSKRNGRQICSHEAEKMPTLRKWGLFLFLEEYLRSRPIL